MLKLEIRWGCLLLLITVLFYWKILLTGQFSLLTGSEAVNQGYSWYQFWLSSVRQGTLPLWDPYAFSGRSFAGEMLAHPFYPLNILLALMSFNGSGLLSTRLYNEFFALAHFFAAYFMFALVRDLGLSRFSALVAAICFSLGGFVGEVSWPNYLWGSIWLPVIFLFLMRAFKTNGLRLVLLYASLAGLALGMTILAGGLHTAIMQAVVLFSAAAFHLFQSPQSELFVRHNIVTKTTAVIVVTAGVGLMAGAVQLFPSMEYSHYAVRWFGPQAPLPATQKIPYAYLQDKVAPQGVFMLLLFDAFNGKVGTGEVLNPYLGVFPLLLAVIGVWKTWNNPWVRYVIGLAAAAFFFSFGSLSLLHGLAYALVPFLWMAREAGRFVYLTDFALALLTAFGAETLFSSAGQPTVWVNLNRILKWVVIGCVVILSIPAFFGQPQIQPLIAFSILLILASCALFFFITRGHTGRFARFVTVALILCDLSAFDGTARNKIEVASRGTDQLDRLLSCRGAVDFIKSQPGLFRVQVLADPAPNIGDVFQIQTTWGGGATATKHYLDFTNTVSSALDLLNVRYFMKPATATEPGAVYQDAAWKIYENSRAFPRAWLVHETALEPVRQTLLSRLEAPGMDLHRRALLSEPLDANLEPMSISTTENVRFQSYESNTLKITVRAESRGLLVLSEIYYPGWHATVNGRPVRIREVDGVLKGIVLDSGDNKVTLRYLPGSVLAGAILSGCAFIGTPLALLLFSLTESRII